MKLQSAEWFPYRRSTTRCQSWDSNSAQGPQSQSFSYDTALPPPVSILCMRQRQKQRDALLDLSGELVLEEDSHLSRSAYVCEWWGSHENIDVESQIYVSK